MSFSRKVMLGSVLLLSATSVLANTADLRVIGTIAPSACTPVFNGGATVDYGIIPNTSLSSTEQTTLAPKDIGYTITCNGPVPIYTSWSDGRSGTAVPGGADVRDNFGLGTHGGANIGRYTIRNIATASTGDGNPVRVIQRNTSTQGWFAASPDGGEVTAGGTRNYSFAPVGTLVPGAYTVFVGSLRVTPTIAATSTLNMSTEVVLDGLSTMTVNYL